MAAPDFSKLSYSELFKLSEELNQQIQAQRVEELKVLADGYIKTTHSAGFSLEEAIDALQPSRAKKRAVCPPRRSIKTHRTQPTHGSGAVCLQSV